jgi:hypothetical protein
MNWHYWHQQVDPTNTPEQPVETRQAVLNEMIYKGTSYDTWAKRLFGIVEMIKTGPHKYSG